MSRYIGLFLGFICCDLVVHLVRAFAVGFEATTLFERLSALISGFIVLVAFMVLFKAIFPSSFFHGFIVATGLFLSVDIVLFHWIFGLHRITSGPEANVLEPIFVVIGILFLWYGLSREIRVKQKININI